MGKAYCAGPPTIQKYKYLIDTLNKILRRLQSIIRFGGRLRKASVTFLSIGGYSEPDRVVLPRLLGSCAGTMWEIYT